MKQTEPLMQVVKERLCEWAQWYGKGNQLGLDYPHCSMEYRLMKEANITRIPFGSKPLPVNKPAEEIERLVCQLRQTYAILATVLT